MKKMGLLLLVLVVIIFISLFFVFLFPKTDSSIDLNRLKTHQMIPWGVKMINAPEVWAETTGKNVKIAVMDSGFDFRHPDFGQNVKEGFNAIEPKLLPNDDYGHGTLVTGVIAAKNNSIGVIGVSPDAEIYPVKVLDQYGEGDIVDIVRGIDWCIENKIQIINMSFALKDNDPLLKSSIEKALKSGIIIVASASNSFGGKVGYPASYDGVISVTSVDENVHLAEKSPIGKIDFSAPGVGIVSTFNNEDYKEYSGNSLAAPHITGIIALILENPEQFGFKRGHKLSYDEVVVFLKDISIKFVENSITSGGSGFPSLKKIYYERK